MPDPYPDGCKPSHIDDSTEPAYPDTMDCPICTQDCEPGLMVVSNIEPVTQIWRCLNCHKTWTDRAIREEHLSPE